MAYRKISQTSRYHNEVVYYRLVTVFIYKILIYWMKLQLILVVKLLKIAVQKVICINRPVQSYIFHLFLRKD